MAKSFLKRSHIKLYQHNMNRLFSTFNRSIDIVIGKAIPSINWDPVNASDIESSQPIQYDDRIYTIENVLVSWVDEENLYQYLPGGRVVPGDVVLKVKIDDVLASGTDRNNDTLFDLPTCRKIIVDGQTVKPKGKAVKGGLKDLYTCSVVCERMQNV
jgi:hypothetical protein